MPADVNVGIFCFVAVGGFCALGVCFCADRTVFCALGIRFCADRFTFCAFGTPFVRIHQRFVRLILFKVCTNHFLHLDHS